jgi:hypothetical protein
MATNKTLKALAQRFPECLPIHKDIKKLMPERDALKLLHNGFTDCSWSNDECPSYFFDVVYNDDGATLMVVDDIDDNYNRVSDKIVYVISAVDVDGYKPYTNIEDAIKAYKLHLIKEEA